ncbi:Activator of Hsp90 ATPase 1 family protein [Paraburkholderia ribeironis]|uniref:Activator of Hsp90 ATPase 1 family protein n=1 Tax=Paraburkholderia ribeironis TaxID=1247936 RepID=A0A1N7SK81_9BURK|nr:SRPBCC domain-containing protein [Paraburkholderia ribeironis]SIT47375.1 Activator of Hsp90 ATPase 1 family protein [Paraburkholderia ribeironis]
MKEEKPSLTIVRRLKAPPAKVYAAWTRPELMARWWGPDAGPVLSAEADPRVGGRFRVVFQTLDGETHDCRGEYREVEPDRKLVFTWEWVTMPERRSLVTLRLRAIEEGTELNLTHSQFFDEAARDAHRTGWTSAFEKLERLVAELARAGD